ncbi:hypothetical protein R1sor_025055 [Riccia sorocarpa]|uniref:Uncharacterized protein n=1 Tax=Riccia sorocarpa TaxID=122646 RepID=A0ABD3G7F9_9MARC
MFRQWREGNGFRRDIGGWLSHPPVGRVFRFLEATYVYNWNMESDLRVSAGQFTRFLRGTVVLPDHFTFSDDFTFLMPDLSEIYMRGIVSTPPHHEYQIVPSADYYYTYHFTNFEYFDYLEFFSSVPVRHSRFFRIDGKNDNLPQSSRVLLIALAKKRHDRMQFLVVIISIVEEAFDAFLKVSDDSF